MNHQTEALIEEAKRTISDEGIFSRDQIVILCQMIDAIADAFNKEIQCVASTKSGIDI